MALLRKLLATQAPAAVILIRLMVGAVFLSEGLQKFLRPDSVGAGRFAKIGFPNPEFVAGFVGAFEITCGTLILLGLLTRLAVLPTITIMLVALASTKLPILMEKGFWDMAHEARTDWSMLLGSLFLLLVGSGSWGLDARLATRPDHEPA
jgi:putative oxidoreductase